MYSCSSLVYSLVIVAQSTVLKNIQVLFKYYTSTIIFNKSLYKSDA